jgi:hypothetical protein
LALAGLLRRRREGPAEEGDPRAEELRRKLAESREEREEAALADPESRRRAVHESARATVEQMRKR